jgi:ABC-type sugar transport system ATPase subunit
MGPVFPGRRIERSKQLQQHVTRGRRQLISGGEAQRMLIGRRVLGMPIVMLLDEPTIFKRASLSSRGSISATSSRLTIQLRCTRVKRAIEN